MNPNYKQNEFAGIFKLLILTTILESSFIVNIQNVFEKIQHLKNSTLSTNNVV